jgi:hypothetical protein
MITIPAELIQDDGENPKIIYVAFNQQADYTDRAAAADQRKLVPTFADRGVLRGPSLMSFFNTATATFFFKKLLIYAPEAEWIPFQPHYFPENMVAPGIESGTSGSVARSSDTRPQQR